MTCYIGFFHSCKCLAITLGSGVWIGIELRLPSLVFAADWMDSNPIIDE